MSLNHLQTLCDQDIVTLKKAALNYGDSWKRRGGMGAFMMLARKWDRIERWLEGFSPPYDIFTAIASDQRPEGIIDDIRDLRRYLLLVESEMMARGIVVEEVKK